MKRPLSSDKCSTALDNLTNYAKGGSDYSNGYAAIGMARVAFEDLCDHARKGAAIAAVGQEKCEEIPQTSEATTSSPFSALIRPQNGDVEQLIESTSALLESLIDQAHGRNAADAVAKLEHYASNGSGFPNAEAAIRFTTTALNDASLRRGAEFDILNFEQLTWKIQQAIAQIAEHDGSLTYFNAQLAVVKGANGQEHEYTF